MITRPLDTIFHSSDRIRCAGADLLVHLPADGRLHRSVTGLLAALDQFEAGLSVGAAGPQNGGGDGAGSGMTGRP